MYPGLNWSYKVALVTYGNVKIGFSLLIQRVQECLSEQPVLLAGWWQVLLSAQGWRLEHKRLGLGERLTGPAVSGVAQKLFS